MSKEDLVSSIVYLLMIAVAVAVGYVMLAPIIQKNYLSSGGVLFCFLILSLIVGLIINSILVEIGHLVGAKIGKYEILAFNILGLAIYKVKEKDKYLFKFKFPKTFDGLTGETLITPKNDKARPMLFVFLPLVMFLIEVLGCICAFLYIADTKSNDGLMFLKYGILISTIVGSMIVIYNYFPTRLDNMNDGYRLVLLNKKINIDAFNELLRIQRNEFFNEPNNNIRQFEQITDFTAQVNMMGAEQAIDNNYEYSLEIIDNILSQKDKISKNTLFDIKLTKCFILLLYKDVEEGKTFYLNEFNDEERKRISSCNRIDTIKVYLLYAGLVEKSDSEVEYALEKSIKALRKALPGVKDKEKKLLDLAINKVKVKEENV